MPLRCTQKLRCELLQNSPSQRLEVQRNAPLQGDRRVLSHSPGTLEEVHHLQTSEPQGQVVLCISRNAMEQAEKPASPSTCRTGYPGDSEVQKHAPLQGDSSVLSHSPGTLEGEQVTRIHNPQGTCSAHFEIHSGESRNSRPLQSAPCHGRHVLRAPQQRLLLGCL